MESSSSIESRRQHLLAKATRVNKKSSRLQNKIQREVTKRSPDMTKINKWQGKSAKYVNKGHRYLDEIAALDQDNQQATEISFQMEKVCFCVQILM
jgi:hypothetical protein